VKIEPETILQPNASYEARPPLSMMVGTKFVKLVGVREEAGPALMSLPEMTLATPQSTDLARLHATIARSKLSEGALDNESLVQWVQALLAVLHSAASTLDFFPLAARALVNLVGLDSGRVLLRENERWVVRASEFPEGPRVGIDDEWVPSRQVLNSVFTQKKTFWQDAAQMNITDSLVGVKAVVAAPILDRAGTVTGVLYGERRRGVSVRIIDKLEAMLVEMLASGVAAGMSRVHQEQEAVKARCLMEQFFTADLANQLAENPRLLEARDGEVSVLSVDVRGFSRICDRLGPTRTLEWLHDVLGTLSDCVLDEQGVLVDYVGDELMAMWGAPRPQPDHAQRACRAALQMLAKVKPLNERWQTIVEEPIDFSIGVNSGVARVGNVGSERKFKYGALGNTVNLASRIQGATKYLKSNILITNLTKKDLEPTMATRKLCQVKVINIPHPIEIHELAPPQRQGWQELKQSYEEALAFFESKDFRHAARVLGSILAQTTYREDGPSLVLMQRTVTCLVEEPVDFSPVWKLPGK
jgi:adenylate cyclase